MRIVNLVDESLELNLVDVYGPWVFTCFPMPVDPFLGKIPSNFLTWDFPEVGIQSRWASSTQGWAMFVFCHIFCPWKTLFVPCNLLVFWHQKIRNIMKYTSIHVLAHELHICFKFWDRLFFVDAGLLVLWGSFFFQDLKWKRANQNTWISTSLSYTVFCIHVLSNITLSWLPTLLSFLWGGGE